MTQQTMFFADCETAPRPVVGPPHNGTETSIAAAESMKEHANRLRRLVLETIQSAGAIGMTTDEVEVSTGLAHQTASPRVIENRRAGRIVEARDGEGNTLKRPTRSGRRAVIYVAAEFATPSEGPAP